MEFLFWAGDLASYEVGAPRVRTEFEELVGPPTLVVGPGPKYGI